MQNLGQLIKKHAAAHQVRPEIVAAVILHESDGAQQYAGRIEETSWLWRVILGRTRKQLAGWTPEPGKNPSLNDEKMWRAQSYGYMQILGETARVLGYKGTYLAGLYDPDTNLHFGCMFLRRCFLATVGDNQDEITHYKRALLRYNGGADKLYPAKVLQYVDSGAAARLLAE